MRAPLIPSPLERVLPIVSPAPVRSARPLTRPFDRLRTGLQRRGKEKSPSPAGRGVGVRGIPCR